MTSSNHNPTATATPAESSRTEIALERLDRLICWSEDIDEGALSFAFRPLWQLDEPAKAALALSRAQATQVYAGLKLWPDAVMARLAEAQLVADGTYPNGTAVFAEAEKTATAIPNATLDYNPAEPRNLVDPEKKGQWTAIPIADDCAEEWATAYRMCAEYMTMNDPPRGVTGGYRSIPDCARGLVSERCGGNPVSYRRWR